MTPAEKLPRKPGLGDFLQLLQIIVLLGVANGDVSIDGGSPASNNLSLAGVAFATY